MLPMILRQLPPTPTPQPTNTATPTSTPVSGVFNGDFESGPVGWEQYSSNGVPLIVPGEYLDPLMPHSGNWAAWLGGLPDEDSRLSQQVTVPVNNPTLYYWHWILSEDFCSVNYDIAGVLINGTAVDAFLLCEDNNTYGWVLRSIPLSQYAGQLVQLDIVAFTDSILNSHLFIDDVSFSTPLYAGGRDPINHNYRYDELAGKFKEDIIESRDK